MKRNSLWYLPVLLLVAATAFVKCGSSNSNDRKTATDSTSPMGPAPDNNAANNPSLADTAYEKDRTRPITDTMKKDSGR
jgi:hypothetical protein